MECLQKERNLRGIELVLLLLRWINIERSNTGPYSTGFFSCNLPAWRYRYVIRIFSLLQWDESYMTEVLVWQYSDKTDSLWNISMVVSWPVRLTWYTYTSTQTTVTYWRLLGDNREVIRIKSISGVKFSFHLVTHLSSYRKSVGIGMSSWSSPLKFSGNGLDAEAAFCIGSAICWEMSFTSALLTLLLSPFPTPSFIAFLFSPLFPPPRKGFICFIAFLPLHNLNPAEIRTDWPALWSDLAS